MTCYKNLDALMQGRTKDKKKLANNTYAIRAVDHIAVRLHNTDVVKHYQNGDTVLDSGGWRTATTKDRINSFSSARIYQENSLWYVAGAKKLFADGMRITAGGKVTGASAVKPKTFIKEKKSIAKFAGDYMTALLKREIPAPSNGDCWYCLMRTEGGETLGEATKNPGHIKAHIKERYFVPSLILRATEAFPVSEFAKSIFALAWNPAYKDRAVTEWEGEITRRQMGSSLKRYLYRQFGLAA